MENTREKYERWDRVLDKIFSDTTTYKREKPKQEVIIPQEDSSFDFELIVFNRLKGLIGDSKMPMKEYYRKMAVLYSLRKDESRLLLSDLKNKFGIKSNNKYLWIRNTQDDESWLRGQIYERKS